MPWKKLFQTFLFGDIMRTIF